MERPSHPDLAADRLGYMARGDRAAIAAPSFGQASADRRFSATQRIDGIP
jgi:hypothetical protein